MGTGGTPATWEDLGGPTPENYKADDDSAKLKTPGATLKQVKDIVNKGAKPAEPMKAGVKEEEEKPADQVVSEEETTEEEVVVEDKIDVEEDLNALISGEELSEEFQEKARTILKLLSKQRFQNLRKNSKLSTSNL